MAFPFSVGEVLVQGTLDWVAETPPARARDTHAVRFRLCRSGTGASPDTNAYSGYMFYRPPGVGTSFVARRPGLDGFGDLLATQDVCQNIVANTPFGQVPELVKVFLAFREQPSGTAEVIATLTFMDGDMERMPTHNVGEVVEFSHVEMSGVGDGIIHMDPPDGWALLLRRATVLLKEAF